MEQLTVTSLTSDATGLATLTRQDGLQHGLQHGLQRKVEIPFTLPGEVVDVEIGRARRRRLFAMPQAIVKASPLRRVARCRHFGSCGGCKLQHLPYGEQLQWKEAKVRALFLGETNFHPIIASQSEWNYRNKMELSFSETAKGEKFLGLIMTNTRGHVFNLQECHLVDGW
ncbi:MAG TPA: hypothetical protein VN457_04780, partial [Chlamydiales bacterium]|nr:hypothetical protein [Chlamydiales bacterium]